MNADRAGPAGVRAGGLPICTDRISSYSLQVASKIWCSGAQALEEALAVNRTLEILE